MVPHIATILLFFTLLATPGALFAQDPAAQDPSLQDPVRLAISAFDTSAEVEVRGLPPELADAAARAALKEIFEIDRLHREGVAAVNAAAGGPVQVIDERLGEMILRGMQFCIWSSGAYGPLGGELRRLWSGPSRPKIDDLRWALGSGECNRVILEDKTHVNLLEGSVLDLTALGRGMAVDRAMGVLQAHGVDNAWIEIGNVWRALGEGPDGDGWYVVLPPIPGNTESLDQIWLRDQSLVYIGLGPEEDRMDELIIDQRSGVPASGVVSVVTVAERAVDAQPLAVALFILGRRDGQPRLGTLEPRPAVYWLLGAGDQHALEATYHWEDLQRFRPID